MNTTHANPILINRSGVPNAAVPQGADRAEQLSAYADPAPLTVQEAQRIAMLLLSAAPAYALPRVARPSRPPEQKGGRLDIRA